MKSLTTLVLGVTCGALAFAEGGHNLRGLKKDTVAMCFNLSSNANGGFGQQTIEVPYEQQRFMSRASQVTRGTCKTHGPIPSPGDRSKGCFCRKRGGNKGNWFNFCGPRFLEDFLLNQDFIKGACSNIRNANNVEMSLVVQASGDDDTFCIDVDGDGYQHTVDVNYPSRLENWLNNKADGQGPCSGGDNGNGGSKKSSVLCVKILSKWYTVETQESLEEFWEDSAGANNVEYDSCDDINKDYKDIIEMYHSSGGGNNNDDNAICIEFDFDDVDSESHTVKVEVTPSSKKDDVLDWFEDLNGDNRSMNYGNCSPDDEHESNQGSTRGCVRLDGISGWWDIESYEWFDGFWEDESTRITWNSCSSINRNSEGTIKLSHK